jgi:hypothetical protein
MDHENDTGAFDTPINYQLPVHTNMPVYQLEGTK